MNIKRGLIKLENLQIKSIDKARKLAEALNTIEEECGIHEVMIELVDPYICCWIDLDDLNRTDMEVVLSEILKEIRTKQPQ